jgi:hypothetical protein
MASREFVEKARIAATNEVFQETIEAGKVMRKMYEQNRLPGVLKGDHGQITSEYKMLMISNNLIEVVYPLSQTFYLVKTGETSTNNYTFEQLSKGSAWCLKKAWETDSSGQTIKTWPIE